MNTISTYNSNCSKQEICGNTNTGFLKLVALFFMIIDHVGLIFFPEIISLRILGRIAFPLYVWCLVVGCVKTHNPYKYIVRLLGLALLSQPFFMLCFSKDISQLNVIFTLALGAIAITGIRVSKYGSNWIVPILCFAICAFFKVDYGFRGLAFILFLYGARKTRSGLLVTFLAFSMYWGTTSLFINHFFNIQFSFLQWKGIGTILSPFFRLQGMVWLALPFILIPMHTSLKLPKKIANYCYPLHFIILYLINLIVKTTR